MKSKSEMRRLTIQGAPVCWLCGEKAITDPKLKAHLQRCKDCLGEVEDEREPLPAGPVGEVR